MRPTLRRLSLQCAGCVLVTSLVLMGGAPKVTAEDSSGSGDSIGSFRATSAAEGIRFVMSSPDAAVVDPLIDGGGPVAESLLDGLGNSQAFASAPYPGDLAVTGPSTGAGLLGAPSPPPYPFYVDSLFPTKQETKADYPGMELAARSSEDAAESSVSMGNTSGDGRVAAVKAVAMSSRDAATSVIGAEAISTGDLVNIGGVLRIGHFVARAKTTRARGNDPERESEFNVSAVSIAGQEVSISEQGFKLAGQSAPLAADNPLMATLKQNGISVDSVAPHDDPDGVVSPGLVIRQKLQLPEGRTVVLNYVLGRASAHVSVSGTSSSTPPAGRSSDDKRQAATGPVGTRPVDDAVRGRRPFAA